MALSCLVMMPKWCNAFQSHGYNLSIAVWHSPFCFEHCKVECFTWRSWTLFISIVMLWSWLLSQPFGVCKETQARSWNNQDGWIIFGLMNGQHQLCLLLVILFFEKILWLLWIFVTKIWCRWQKLNEELNTLVIFLSGSSSWVQHMWSLKCCCIMMHDC